MGRVRARVALATIFATLLGQLVGGAPCSDSDGGGDGSCAASEGPGSELGVGALEDEEAAALRVELLQKAGVSRHGVAAAAKLKASARENTSTTNSTTNSTSAGNCTAEDKQKMDAVGYGNELTSLGGKIYLCAVGNVDFHLQIKPGPMKECIMRDIGLSDGCAQCFTYSSVQGCKFCKKVCLNGWCSKTCQDCNEKVVPSSEMEQCTGYALPKTPPCA